MSNLLSLEKCQIAKSLIHTSEIASGTRCDSQVREMSISHGCRLGTRTVQVYDLPTYRQLTRSVFASFEPGRISSHPKLLTFRARSSPRFKGRVARRGANKHALKCDGGKDAVFAWSG